MHANQKKVCTSARNKHRNRTYMFSTHALWIYEILQLDSHKILEVKLILQLDHKEQGNLQIEAIKIYNT